MAVLRLGGLWRQDRGARLGVNEQYLRGGLSKIWGEGSLPGCVFFGVVIPSIMRNGAEGERLGGMLGLETSTQANVGCCET